MKTMRVASHLRDYPTELRVLDYARGSWQRLGHLKLLCSVASPSYGTSLEGITSKFQSYITAPKTVPLDRREEMEQYIKVHRPSELKRLPQAIELQDYFLADKRLPSQVGALTGRSRSVDYLHMEYVEIPAWAVRLRLLREGNYTLTDRGKILTKITPSQHGSQSTSDGSESNPFLLNIGEKLLFMYGILESDGDLIKGLYGRLNSSNSDFSKMMAHDAMRATIEELISRYSPRPTGVRTEPESIKLKGILQVLAGESDQIVLPRIEPLIDCGLVIRSEGSRSSYHTTANAGLFLQCLNRSGHIGDFLSDGLAEGIVSLLGLTRGKSLDSIRLHIGQSYLQMRTGLGYCSIRELAMLAVAKAIEADQHFFEIADVEHGLFSLAEEFGTKVRFTKNRQGDIALVRIDTKLAEGLNASV